MTIDSVATLRERDWATEDPADVEPLRYAVVGLGGYARNVSLPAIERGSYAAVGAVVSGDPTKADRVAAEYDAVPLSYESYAAGEATGAYDAVYVATPNREHRPHVETAAEHGRHVLCEKPLDATVDRAAASVEACAAADVRLMTAYRMQTDPVVRGLRRLIAEGVVGDPVKLFGDFTFPVLAGDRGVDQWRLDAALAGGGALYDVGVYPLNTARFLLDADPVAVTATAVGGDGEERSSATPFAEVDAHTHFHVEFPDGVVGNFSASFRGAGNATLTLVGTDGRVRVEDAFQPSHDRRVVVETGDERVEIEGVGGDETVAAFDYFAHAVRTDGAIDPDADDGLTDQRVLAAIRRAATDGERVAL